MSTTSKGLGDRIASARLYGICDLGYVSVEQAARVSRELLEGGVEILQLRAKGYDPQDLFALACELKALCTEFAVPFVVNDHLELARKCEADGLHLGQDDGAIGEARALLGEGILIGRSTHGLDQAINALKEGASYIGFGPLYPTPTKEGRPAIGLDEISAMEQQVGSTIPAFCIGGITPEVLPEVIASGARRVVVVSHLLTHCQPSQATRHLLSQLNHSPL